MQTSRSLAALACIIATAASADDTDKLFTRTLYLIRHGAYEESAKGDADRHLTPLGIAQARLVAARMRTEQPNFTAITSSTLVRAKETAAVIRESVPGAEAGENALLSECTPRSSVRLENPPKDEEAIACEGRIDQAFKQYFVPAKGSARAEMLVIHGNVIRYLVLKSLGQPTADWLKISVAHTSVTVIQVRADGTMKLLSVGDIGHVPPNLRSGTTAVTPQLVTPS